MYKWNIYYEDCMSQAKLCCTMLRALNLVKGPPVILIAQRKVWGFFSICALLVCKRAAEDMNGSISADNSLDLNCKIVIPF